MDPLFSLEFHITGVQMYSFSSWSELCYLKSYFVTLVSQLGDKQEEIVEETMNHCIEYEFKGVASK
jgi:hypothetical protein